MGQEKIKPVPGRNTYKSVMSLQDISARKVCQWPEPALQVMLSISAQMPSKLLYEIL